MKQRRYNGIKTKKNKYRKSYKKGLKKRGGDGNEKMDISPEIVKTSSPRITRKIKKENIQEKAKRERIKDFLIGTNIKREIQIEGKRTKPKIANFSYIISHGEYLDLPRNVVDGRVKQLPEQKEIESILFRTPYNIHLLQYTIPGDVLNITDAYSMLKQLSKMENGKIKPNMELKEINPPPILKNKSNGQLYFPHEGIVNSFLDIAPNSETTNLWMTFDNKYNEYTSFFNMHVGMPDGRIVYPCENPNDQECIINIDLKSLLNSISENYKNLCEEAGIENPKPLYVIQLSCKFGKDFYDVENLSQLFENISLEQYKCERTEQIIKSYYELPENENKSEEEIKRGYFSWLEKNYEPIYIHYKNVQELNNIKKKYCVPLT